MDVGSELANFRPRGAKEERDIEELRHLVSSVSDPWDRTTPLHLTASALVVDPERRLLVRWHERQQRWLQTGGHADPGESAALVVAMREACEETGLDDLVPVSDRLVHLAVVDVLPGKGEPPHRHGDLRYLLSTSSPSSVVAEDAVADLRWLSFDDASAEFGGTNLGVLIERAGELLRTPGPAPSAS